jgi:hypothetical protein
VVDGGRDFVAGDSVIAVPSSALQSGTGAAPQGMFTNVMIPLTATSPSQPQAGKTQ